MKIEIRSNTAVIEGYVNAVGRDSRILMSPEKGKFVEQVLPKTFQKAIERGKEIELRLNHRKTLGSTQSNLKLYEDNIGLYARAEVSDEETVAKARNKELRGWSFGFVKLPNGDQWEDAQDGILRRKLSDIELREVSILDKTPAYIGTSIETREEDTFVVEFRSEETEAEVNDHTPITPDFALQEKEIDLLELKKY